MKYNDFCYSHSRAWESIPLFTTLVSSPAPLYGHLTFFYGLLMASSIWQQIHLYGFTCAGFTQRSAFMTVVLHPKTLRAANQRAKRFAKFSHVTCTFAAFISLQTECWSCLNKVSYGNIFSRCKENMIIFITRDTRRKTAHIYCEVETKLKRINWRKSVMIEIIG